MRHIHFLCLFLCLLLLPTAALATDTPVDLQGAVIFEIGSSTAVFGGERQKMDAPVIIRNDRSAIPVKFIGEWFGGSVEWDGDSRSAVLTFPEVTICATIDDPELQVNGSTVTVDPAPFIYQDRTFLSIRTVADLLGKHLYYNGNDQPVILTDEEIPPEALTSVWEAASEALHPSDLLQWPLAGYYQISAIFDCDNPDCYSHNGGKNGHGALDIPAPAGTPVTASADGVVTFAGFGDSSNSYSGYGNIVVLDHGDGILTHYAHLADISVSVGDVVSSGELVGTVGSTGIATGNHLDYAVWKEGQKVDPFLYLDIPEKAVCYEDCDQPFLEAARDK